MAYLQQIQESELQVEVTDLGWNTYSDSNLEFTLVGKSYATNPYVHIFSTFGLPIVQSQINYYITPYAKGGYVGTAFEILKNTDDIVVFNIGQFEGSTFDGKSFRMTIPLSGNASGCTSGLTATTLYGTYMSNGDENVYTPGLCQKSLFDSYYSDPNAEVSDWAHNPFTTSNVNPYKSGLVFLFSDDIQPPNVESGCTGTTSWADGYGVNEPYTNGKITFNGLGNGVNKWRDIPVGIFHTHSGVGVITHPELVNDINWASALSATSATTEAVFSSTDAFVQAKTVETTFTRNYTAIALPGQFNRSENPTWGQPGGIDGCNSVYVTNGGLYNTLGQLIAVFTLSEPQLKSFNETVVFNITLQEPN